MLTIALKTNTFSLGLAINNQATSAPSDPSLLWLALALSVAILGLALDMVAAGGGVVALGPGALGMGMAIGLMIMEVKNEATRRMCDL